MTLSLVIGTLIFGWLLFGCVLVVIDIFEECEFQTREAEHEELLDEMWSDEAA